MKRFIEGTVFHFVVLGAIFVLGGIVFLESRHQEDIVRRDTITAAVSAARMQRAVKPRVTIVTNKCSLNQAQRIWQVLALDAPNKPEAGALIPFADLTAFYDGREWWCSETKGPTK